LLLNQNKQRELESKIDLYKGSVQPIKGEFEKDTEYKKRVVEFNNNSITLEKLVTPINDLKSHGIVLNTIINNIKEYKSNLSQPKQLPNKLENISVYDSEKESFFVNIREEKFRIYIPISEAQLFKSSYSNIEIYRFSDGINRLFFNKNIFALIDKNNDIQSLNQNEFIEKLIVRDNNGKDWLYNNDLPCVISFYSSLLPQKMIIRYQNELINILNENVGRINIYTVNIDDEKEFARFFYVSNVPRFIYIPRDYNSKNGKLEITKGLLGNEVIDTEVKKILWR